MKLGRFPSIDALLKAAGHTFSRFTLTIISALVAAGIGVALAEIGQDSPAKYLLQRILAISTLGLPLFTVLVLYAEKKGKSSARLLFQGIGVLLLAAYYFTLPEDFFRMYSTPAQYVLISITLHFLVAYLPFLGGDQINGFWQYNKSLFLRFLTSALFSAVLFIGLAIALAAMDYLFGVDVDEEQYLELWIIISLVIHTWIFLAGLPDNISSLSEVHEYPKGLQIFSQYVLLPLVGLYLVILYLYEFKIIASWNWPKGWVSELILWYSAVGILALLLLWPLRELTASKWVRTYANWFFRLLVPLVGMLFFAILYRVNDYGITPNRYFVFAMAIGLSAVVLYFVFRRKKDIRIIPIVISLLALLSAFGPWNAFSVSEKSQINRLSVYLEKYNLVSPVEQKETKTEISIDDRQEMSSLISYLTEWHGEQAFKTWLPDSMLAKLKDSLNVNNSSAIASWFGFQLSPMTYYGSGNINYFYLGAEEKKVIDISGYQYQIGIPSHAVLSGTPFKEVLTDSLRCSVNFHQSTHTLKVTLLQDSLTTIGQFDFVLHDTLLGLYTNTPGKQIPQDQLTFFQSTDQFISMLLLKNVSGNVSSDSLTIDSFDANIYIGRR